MINKKKVLFLTVFYLLRVKEGEALMQLVTSNLREITVKFCFNNVMLRRPETPHTVNFFLQRRVSRHVRVV